MAKIQRYGSDVKPFAVNSTGTERTVFGDTTQSDTLDGNVTAEFLAGWETLAAGGKPPKQWFNAFGYTVTLFIAYLHQMGIPEYDIEQEFPQNGITQLAGKIYRSLTDGNINNDPATDSANWLDLDNYWRSPVENGFIDGSFNIWPEGTSFTDPVDDYTAGMYVSSVSTGAGTITRQAFTPGQTDVPGNPNYFLRHVQSGAAASLYSVIQQRVESAKTYAGQQVVWSFWARAGANLQLIPNVFQNFGTGGSPSATAVTTLDPITVTTSWQRFSIVIDVPSVSGKTFGTDANDFITFVLRHDDAQTFTFETAEWFIHPGGEALTKPRDDYATERARSERYVERGGYNILTSYGQAGAQFSGSVDFKATKRAIPTVTTTLSGQNNTTGPTTFAYLQEDGMAPRRTVTATGGANFSETFLADARL